MQHITGIQRNQMMLSSLEDTITADNPVWFIDVFSLKPSWFYNIKKEDTYP